MAATSGTPRFDAGRSLGAVRSTTARGARITARGDAGPRLDGSALGEGAETGEGCGAPTGAAVGALACPGLSGAMPGRATPMIVFWLGGISGAVPGAPELRGACAAGGTGGGGGAGYAIVAGWGGAGGCGMPGCALVGVGGAMPMTV